jgi:hypothetical protein
MGKTLFIQGVGHGPSSEKIRCMSTHTCTLRSVRGSGNSRSPMSTHPMLYSRRRLSRASTATVSHATVAKTRAQDRLIRRGRPSDAFAALIWLMIASSPARAKRAKSVVACHNEPPTRQECLRSGRIAPKMEMILSDAEVGALLTTSATPGANRSAPAKFSRPASHTNGRRNKSDKQLKTRRPRPQG